MILARQTNREKQADDFFKHLADKYSGGASSKSASSSSSAKKTTGSRKRKESHDGTKKRYVIDE
jgi:hypothetical protein